MRAYLVRPRTRRCGGCQPMALLACGVVGVVGGRVDNGESTQRDSLVALEVLGNGFSYKVTQK
jgi:hypothetical protein